MKTPRGFEPYNGNVWDGQTVILKEEYGGGRKYVAAELSGGCVLLADTKKMCNDGRGYIYGSYAIEFVKKATW